MPAAGGGAGRHRGLPHTSIAGASSSSRLASIGCVLAPSLALADHRAHAAGAGRLRPSWPSNPRWFDPSIRVPQLGRGLGFNTTVVATSLAAGPSLGAALLAITSWPILFAVYIPLGVLSFFLAGRFLPVTTHAHPPTVRRAFGGAVRRHVRPADLRRRWGGVTATPLPADRGRARWASALFGTLFVWRQTQAGGSR